jgi:HSP20 family molecular chaperone IbpA
MSVTTPVYVVTCRVPPCTAKELRVDIADRTVRVTGPRGFERTFELPRNVAIESLQWEVYTDILELRAPLRGAEP